MAAVTKTRVTSVTLLRFFSLEAKVSFVENGWTKGFLPTEITTLERLKIMDTKYHNCMYLDV